VKEMRLSPPKPIFEQFLSNLRTHSKRKRFGFDLKLIKRDLQLYRFNDHHKPYFLFIHESLGSFWEMSSNWQEITHLLPSENTNWAVILLQKPGREDSLSGFLLSNNDFVMMTPGFGINRMGRIKIHKKDLSLKHQFDDWDGFFQRLHL
jgi:hypothetical protein